MTPLCQPTLKTIIAVCLCSYLDNKPKTCKLVHKMRRSQAPSALSKRQRYAPVPKKRASILRPVKARFGLQAFPKQLFNTVKYSELVSVTQAVGVGTYKWSANGLYDPNITSTGSQPLYFDQLMTIYDHYTVLKSKIKLTCASPNGSLIQYVLYVDDDSTTYTNASTALQFPGAVGKFGNTISQPFVLYNYFDAAKMFGPNPQAQDSLQGNATTMPSEQSVYTLVIYDTTLTSTTNVSVMVEIEYQVVWDELATVAAS